MKPTIFISKQVITFENLKKILADNAENGVIHNLWMTDVRVIDVPQIIDPIVLFGEVSLDEEGLVRRYPMFLGYILKGATTIENNVFTT